MSVKDKIVVVICALLFGAIGVYLTFVSGNVNRYDSQTIAHRIEVDEQYDDGSTMYYPVYYFNVNGNEYMCRSRWSPYH